MKAIEKSWNAFLENPFPDSCRGLEAEEFKLISLDTFSAGCIDAFIANKGHLNPQEISALRNCAQEIDEVVKYLEGDAQSYFEHLRSVTRQVLKAVS